jgi:hypothetical protein
VRCQLKMPKVGDAADTAVVISLSAAVGDQVAAGQELLVVETDKSNVEVPSPVIPASAAISRITSPATYTGIGRARPSLRRKITCSAFSPWR